MMAKGGSSKAARKQRRQEAVKRVQVKLRRSARNVLEKAVDKLDKGSSRPGTA
jgi:hypothetical protein